MSARRFATSLPLFSFLLAASLLTSLTEACGGGPSEEDVRRSQAEYDLGVGLMHEQNVAGAFQHLGEAVRLDPDNAEAHLLLGNLHLFREDYDRAEHYLREALRANAALIGAGRPALNAEARNSLGVVYIHARRYDDAVRELREATGDLMNHTPHLAWGNLGWAYFEMNDHEQALLALEEAVRRQPRFCGAWFRMGQVRFAQAAPGGLGTADSADLIRQSLERADEALTHALEVDDDACRALQDAWRLRGETRARLERRDEAVADFERCVELGRETEAGQACARMLEPSP
jgi:tetratricopeptide (TPR) repeat protein